MTPRRRFEQALDAALGAQDKLTDAVNRQCHADTINSLHATWVAARAAVLALFDEAGRAWGDRGEMVLADFREALHDYDMEALMTELEIDELESMRAQIVRGVFQADYDTWDRRNPQPEHPELGLAKCPDIKLIERITPDGDDAHVYVHQARFHAGATWESPMYPDNEHTLMLAGYVARLINAAPQLTRLARAFLAPPGTPPGRGERT